MAAARQAGVPLAERQVFTTHEAARLCGLSHRTLCKAFDTGLLKGYRIPGSKTRRIPRPQLIAFATGHGLPCPLIDTPTEPR